MRTTAETYILLRGRIDVMFYDAMGAEVQRFALNPLKGNYGVHIPKVEVKDGPYKPLEPEDILRCHVKTD